MNINQSAHRPLQDGGRFTAREADWRNGAIVYQVLVDRFAPAADLQAKAHLYPAPKRLRAWHELPTAGHYLPEQRLWSHEIDFWGGDLASLRAHLSHISLLGADVLYLNPIAHAYTNHKYDALDFEQVSPEYGSRDDVAALAQELHARGMKLVLDGVFNHMGRNAPRFVAAQADAQHPERNWFCFDAAHPGGARVWSGAQNLPELNLEHGPVREHLWEHPNSVVRRYLREGVDGWRLDVAYDIGPAYLQALTQAAHAEKPLSLVVGEIWSYPQAWMPELDAVMNFTLRELLLRLARGELNAATAGDMIERLVADVGMEALLKCWLLLDNHDTERLHTAVPDAHLRRLLQVLQFTLPGSPNLYYGTELGMAGGADPEMRAPMRWDLATPSNPELQWTKQLIALRKGQRALRVGDYRRIACADLLAFERHTERVADTVLVVANPSAQPVSSTLMVRNSMLMNAAPLKNLLQPDSPHEPCRAGLLRVSLPPAGVLVLQPDVAPRDGYTAYKRLA